MPTVLEQYIDAFGISVLKAHDEAMLCCEVEDVLAVGTTLAQRIKSLCDKYLDNAPLEVGRAIQLEQLSNSYLRFATVAHLRASEFYQKGYVISGAERFEEAVLSVRDTLCRLQEPVLANPLALPTDFTVSPPPDSWFQEDHSRLFLPPISKG